ncbi:MAG: NAD-dependent epimerase/dehydratase family protein [Methanosarcina sp.]|nr:NAD-dependent epimerase/dehydratase family protein [Methanosarcina sp.]MDD4522993.1 NAD-dependent epimerase/dehydratase family protein [Methanosarcina sp.]
MKALVTGCAGFIGSNLTDRLLDLDYEVIGIDCFTDYYSRSIKEANLSDALKNSNFKFIEDDISKKDDFPEVDYVFHLAAQAGVRASWGKNFEVYTRNNIEATQKLLEYYKDMNIKKFVYSSSSSVYGDAELPMKEDSLLKPVSPYGASKLVAEHLCYLYWKSYKVPTVSLRYFTVYGPRQRPDMAIHKFIKAILNEEHITIYGDGAQTRDFTYVDDVVNANLLAAESGVNGEVFNIGGGKRITVSDLIVEIERITGKKANLRHIEQQKGDARDTLADVEKGQKVLGWQAEIGIAKGLERYISWVTNQDRLI